MMFKKKWKQGFLGVLIGGILLPAPLSALWDKPVKLQQPDELIRHYWPHATTWDVKVLRWQRDLGELAYHYVHDQVGNVQEDPPMRPLLIYRVWDDQEMIRGYVLGSRLSLGQGVSELFCVFSDKVILKDVWLQVLTAPHNDYVRSSDFRQLWQNWNGLSLIKYDENRLPMDYFDKIRRCVKSILLTLKLVLHHNLI